MDKQEEKKKRSSSFPSLSCALQASLGRMKSNIKGDATGGYTIASSAEI